MDEQHLADLDFRAATAVQALDDAVAEAPIPELPGDRGAPSGHRWLTAAVAAALVLVALVTAGVLLRDDGDDQGTIAGEPETDAPARPSAGHTQLALPDPGALGYQVVAAFPAGDTSAGTFTGRDVTVTVQVPDGAEEPWPVTVVEYALPSDITTLDGEPVDIGGPEATLDLDGAAPTVGWIDGDRTRYLVSADSSVGDLVVLATAAADTEPGAPLPGHDILHTGPFVDVFPMLASDTGTPSGNISGIVYESDVLGFVVGTTHGSPERWRAAHALARAVRQVEVRGRRAVLADFGDNIVEVSWLEADGTLVRVDSLQGVLPIDVLDQLEPISDAAFAALVEQFGVDPQPGESSDEEQGGEPSGVDLARVETGDGDVTTSASVISGGQRELELRTFTEGPTGGTGSGQSLPDLSTNVVVRDVIQLDASDTRGTLLAGLIGPGVGNPRVIDATTGEALTEGTGPLTATIENSEHVLFLATLPSGFEDRDLAIVGTTAAGDEVRLEAPAT